VSRTGTKKGRDMSVGKIVRSMVVKQQFLGRWNFRMLSTSTEFNSSKKNLETNEKVVVTDDGSVIACWHPEVPVPYELTKPMPVEVTPTDSVLKVQALRPTRELFRPKHQQMVVNELMQLTHTSKYTWLPKQRRLRYKEANPLNEKRDREYL